MERIAVFLKSWFGKLSNFLFPIVIKRLPGRKPYYSGCVLVLPEKCEGDCEVEKCGMAEYLIGGITECRFEGEVRYREGGGIKISASVADLMGQNAIPPLGFLFSTTLIPRHIDLCLYISRIVLIVTFDHCSVLVV